MSGDDSMRAVEEMNGKEIDSRPIRVDVARRNKGYEKTPGRYLGPPQMSTKFQRDRQQQFRSGGGGGGGYRGGGGDRGGGYADYQPRDYPR